MPSDRRVNALAALAAWDETAPECPAHAAEGPESDATLSINVAAAGSTNWALAPPVRSAEVPTEGPTAGMTPAVHSHWRRLQSSSRPDRGGGGTPSPNHRSASPASDHCAAGLTPCFLGAAKGRFAPSGNSEIAAAAWCAEDPRACAFALEVAYVERIAAETTDPSKRTTTDEPLPELNKRERAMAAMRSVVSQNKIRFQEDGFDLDLTYITPRIIAMGFPSTGRESYYRNPMPEVERFFAKRHPNAFRIYNLCRERAYDNQSRFGGRHARFPFDDHNAPSDLGLIPAFIKDATAFLKEDDDNVVAIHCKAGKGRTGLIISCLLMATDQSLRDPESALKFFGDVRTADSQGVTIPSQMRYVRYWGTLMERFGCCVPQHQRRLHLNRVVVHSLIKARTGVPLDVYFTVQCDQEDIFDGRKSGLPLSGAKLYSNQRQAYVFDLVGSSSSSAADDDAFAQASASTTELGPRILSFNFVGDVRFTFYVRNKLMADEELFHFWLNSRLCDFPKQHLKKSELDGPSKDRKHRDFCADLAVDLIFEAPEWNVEEARRAEIAAGLAAEAPAEAQTGGKKDKKGFFSRVFGGKK